MATPLRMGFIGGALNSAIGVTHKISSQMDGDFILTAGCFSRNKEMNRQTARAWGVSETALYDDAFELIRSEHTNLDVIVILTPTPAHFEILQACLEYKLPVICEKALVASVGQAKEIEALVSRLEGKLFVTFNYTGYPMIRELRQRIEKGEFGKIQQVMVEMPQEGFARVREDGSTPLPQGWRQVDGEIPTVSLDLGVHIHHLVEFLTSQIPRDVYAVNSTFARVPNVVDTVNIISRFNDEMVCNYWYGKGALGYRNGLKIRIFGTEKSAEWVQMDPEIVRMTDNAGTTTLLDRTAYCNSVANLPRYCRFKAGHPAGFIEAFANYYADIATALRGERNAYAVEAPAAVRGLEFFKKAQESAEISAKIIL